MNISTATIQTRQHGAMECSTPLVDLEVLRRYRLDRIQQKLREYDYAGILLFDPLNCRYACDATNMQVWCTHYETRCVYVATDGPLILFDYGNYPHLAEGISTIDEYRVHSSFYYFAAGERSEEKAQDFGREIADLVRTHGGGNTRLAVDRLSLRGCHAITQHGVEIFDGIEVMERARRIKSPEELVLARNAIAVAETGIARMREVCKPGMTENALWSVMHQTNVEHGGEWIETRLFSSGPRTFPWFQESSMRKMEKGDMLSLDTDLIGPYGYCADMSRSWLCGETKPTQQQARIYALAYEQIQHNMGILKAGMSFREVAEKSWQIPDEFVAHSYVVVYHGVGLADEYPAIMPLHTFAATGYDGMLCENMVLSVESYIGSARSGEGVKLEEMVLIGKDGAEKLTTYPLETDWL